MRPARVDIEDGVIVAVIEGTDLAGCTGELVDLGDLVLGPALINAHTHLAMSALRGLGGVAGRSGNVVEDVWYAMEAHLTADDVRAFARIGAMECLLAGTAVVWDHYYGGRAVADALSDVGLAGVVAPTLQDRFGPGVPVTEAQLQATAELAEDDALAAEGIVAAVGPHATDTVSDALWARVVRLVERYDLPIHVHAAQSVEELERAHEDWGCSPVERLRRVGALEHRVLLVHGLLVSRGDRKLLDPARHALGHCPYSQSQYAWPADPVPWLDDGFAVVVGTDAGACNDTMDVAAELRLVAAGPAYGLAAEPVVRGLLDDAGVEAARGVREARSETLRAHARVQEPETLLAMVTRAPGGLHPRLPTGRIAPGCRADLAVWDPDHPALWPATDPLRAVTFGASSAALSALMVGGRWRLAPGTSRDALLRSDAWRAWRQEASDRLAPLLDRWS